ncbi:MAG: hypothetical protein ACRDVK_02225 [Acidimicrobiia bacterium]
MSRKRLAVLSGVAVVFLLAGTSFALTGEWDFASGYDDENDVLVYGLSEVTSTTGTTAPGDVPDGCAALDGTTVSYGGTTTTTVPPTGQGCELRVVEVANENGVVNHGQVVSSFVQDLKESGVEGGIGCLVREIAGSDYGKGENDTTETTVVTTTTVLSGEVDLTSETVSCGRPEHAGPDEDGEERGGRPEHAGPPDHAGGQGNGNGS